MRIAVFTSLLESTQGPIGVLNCRSNAISVTDPQTLTINAVAQTLNRVSVNGSTSIYQKDDGTVKMTISHQNGKRTRRVIRVDFAKIAQDPLITTQNVKNIQAFYLVFDTPQAGFTVTEQKQVVDSLLVALTASSGALVTQILSGLS